MQDKITKDQLAKKIKSKYPQYNDMDNDVLVDKIIQKYPVYKDQLIDEETEVIPEFEELKKKEDSTLDQELMVSKPKEDSSDISQEDKDSFEIKDYLQPVSDFLFSLSPFGQAAKLVGLKEIDVINSVETGIAEGFTPQEVNATLYSGKKLTKEDAKKLVDASKRLEEVGPSKNMIQFQKDIESYDKEYGKTAATLFALGKNPQVAPEVVLTSMIAMGPAMLANPTEMLKAIGAGAATGAALGSAAGGVGAIPGAIGGAGVGFRFGTNFLLDNSLSVIEFMKEELKGKPFTPENVYELMENEEALDRIKVRAAKRGNTIGVVESIFAGFGKALPPKLTAVTEVAAGGFGELGAQIAADQEIDPTEIILESVGGIVGVPGILAEQKISPVKINGENVNNKDAENVIKNTPAEDLKDMDVNVPKDNPLHKEYKEKVDKQKISEEISPDVPEQNKEQVVDLEYERKQLEGKKTVSAKEKIKEIDQKIKELSRPKEGAEVVAEETVETELVKPELEPKLTYQTSNQTQVTVDESGKFQEAVDLKTGKKRTKETARKAQNELISQRDYTTGKSAFDGVPKGQDVGDPSQFIANESENAQEIAQEYKRRKEEGGILDPVIDAFLGKYIVSKESLKDYYGSTDDLKLIRAYTNKRKGKTAIPLDVIAMEVSEEAGREVTPAELFEIMMDPKYKSNSTPKEADIVTELRNRFIEVTGFDGTDAQIAAIANQDPSKLKPVREPVEVAQEQAAKQEEAQIEERVEQAEEQAKQEREAAVEPKTEGITGRVLDALKKGKDFLKKQVKIHLTAQGLQPDVIYNQRQKRDANIRMYQNRIDRMRKNINSALKKIPKDQRDSVMKEFDQVFRGQVKSKDSNLSLDMRILADRMRMEIDGLSTMIIESGYFDTKEGLEAVQKNIGSYVNRSYRLFSDSNWANKVSEEVKENARRFFRRQAIQEGRTVSEQEIENQINEILNKAEDNKYIVKGKDGRIDKDILRRRKDIPAELRALMGEVTNPLENYQNTVAKQAMLLFNYKFQRKIAESGSNTFFTKSPTKENTVQIVKEGNEAYPELAGLWTTPEIAKTFEMPNPANGHYDAFVKFSSAIKWGKTVGSIATHAKNILGNHGFVLMNGHLDWNEFTNSADLAIKEFRGKTTEEQRAYLDELISLGIVKQSTTLGDITTMYGDSSFEEAYKRTIIDQARNLASKKQKISDTFRASKAGKVTKNVVDKLNDLYQSEDDFFKIMAYGIEKQRYAKALFGKNKADLTKAESDQVNEAVSEIVKNTYPTYDRVPPIIKRLGRSPILGAFVSFRAESIRTAFNTYKIAWNEVKSENKEVAKIGTKRLASAGIYTGLKVTLATQLGLAAQSLMFGGEDDESEEYNDLRKFVASWSQDSLIAITSKEPGKYTFIDLTANDPHSFLSELIIAGRNDNDSTPLFIDKLVALGEPFLGKDLVAAFASEAYLVYNDKKLTTGEKGDKILNEFFKLLQPGTITSAIRLQKAASGNESQFENEVAGFTGYRPVDVDVQKSYLFRAIDLKDRKASLNGRYNRVRYNEKSTEVELEKAYEEVNRDYSQMIKEAQELTKSAIRLGVDSGEIVNILKKNGFSRRDIAFIFSQDEYTYIPTKMRR